MFLHENRVKTWRKQWTKVEPQEGTSITGIDLLTDLKETSFFI
jgi:hypothetical protein